MNAGVGTRSESVTVSERVRTRLRRSSDQSRRLTVLAALSLLCAAVIVAVPQDAPISLMALPLVIGSSVLGPREMPWFVGVTLVALAATLPAQPVLSVRILLATGVIAVLGLVILVLSGRRARLGVAGERGESMLVDLRERILREDGFADLPGGWYAESQLRSAGGTPFAGDFIVTYRDECARRLQIVVVDVSGKGADAGTRALLLSGAFRALLGAVPARDFLSSANDFLVGQDWDEGFATAVHLAIELDTGRFEIGTAGHPPAIWLTSGSGRWRPVLTEGPALGLLPEPDFVMGGGTMVPGDAILLYTDGLVEAPHLDLAMGIDRLVGRAERTLHGGFDHGAGRLIDMLGSRQDDRALVLLHRR